jgi:hypothetical protein
MPDIRIGFLVTGFRYNLQQSVRCGVMRASRGNHEAQPNNSERRWRSRFKNNRPV